MRPPFARPTIRGVDVGPLERRLGWAAAAAGCILGAAFAHRGLYNDGPFFVQWLAGWPLLPGERRVLVYPHLLYLPLASGFHQTVGAALGLRVDDSLRLFSAVAAGVAGLGLVRFFGAFLSLAANAVATSLVLFAPSTLFFAGATELHTLHLAGVAVALAAAARPRGLLPFALGAAFAAATHVSGFLVFPSLVLLHERARPRSWLRASIAAGAALAVVAAVALAAHALMPERSVLFEYFRAVHPAEQGWLETVWTEFVVRAGVVVPIGIAGAALIARSEPLVAAATLITAALYAHLIGRSAVEYQGGYDLPALPILALAGVLAGARLPRRLATALGVLAVATQIGLGVAAALPASRSDPYVEATDAIRRVAKPEDGVVLFYRRADISDFDLPMVSVFTRLYLGRDVPNAALLDERNAAGDAYVDDAGAAALSYRCREELVRGPRSFVHESVLRSAADRPHLVELTARIRERFEEGARDAATGLVELRRR
ncbi:MAG TPA: hypothetical protein VKE69_06145 [Planctomycetota bacterium]|nr:hypothetical protein [Planctomycetota bacterium]